MVRVSLTRSLSKGNRLFFGIIVSLYPSSSRSSEFQSVPALCLGLIFLKTPSDSLLEAIYFQTVFGFLLK